MTEADSDFFFGRQRETNEVLTALSQASDRLPVLLGNSGVGKSSLAQAGVLAALSGRRCLATPYPEANGQALFTIVAAGARSRLNPGSNQLGRWSSRSWTLGGSPRPIPSASAGKMDGLSSAPEQGDVTRFTRCHRATLPRARSDQACGILPLCRPGRGTVRPLGRGPAPAFFGVARGRSR